MANRRNYRSQSVERTAMRYNEPYVYGNTARKFNTVPQRRKMEQNVPRQPKKKEVSQQVKQNRKHALSMNSTYTFFLAFATVATLLVCVWYLQLRFEVTMNASNVAALEQQLADLKEENTTRENSILDSVNLEIIREHAIQDLGMKYVTAEQIVTYQNPVGDYVKQFEEIPKSGMLD